MFKKSLWLAAGVAATAVAGAATAGELKFNVGANNAGAVVQGQYQTGPVNINAQTTIPFNGGQPQSQATIGVTVKTK